MGAFGGEELCCVFEIGRESEDCFCCAAVMDTSVLCSSSCLPLSLPPALPASHSDFLIFCFFPSRSVLSIPFLILCVSFFLPPICFFPSR